VLNGHAGDGLLDSYEAERRPVDARNIQRSLENAMAHLETGRAFGLNRDATAEANWAQMRRIWSGKPEDAEHREGALRAIRQLTMEGNELNVEFGYRYASDAVVPDGGPEPKAVEDIRVYEPSARPGSPLPHAWIDDESGHRRPIKDLVAPGRFLLIAGETGDDWCAAAESIALTNKLPLDAVRIGHLDGDLYDPRLAWAQYRGISAKGAVLIRPDRVVGWRCADGVADAESELADALSHILGSEIYAAAECTA
jgi:2,4-dichlorophenol 6-monooxygenase